MSSKKPRRIPQAKRQKVSIACDGCKKRKFKCSGTKPCAWCFRKGFECTYTAIDKRSLKGQRLAELKRQQELQKPGAAAEPKTEPNTEPELPKIPPISLALSPDPIQLPPTSFVALVRPLTGSQLPSPKHSPPAAPEKSSVGFLRIKLNKFEYYGESSANGLIDEVSHFEQYLHNKRLPTLRADTPFEVAAQATVAELPERRELESILHHFDVTFNQLWHIIELTSFRLHIEKIFHLQTAEGPDYVLLYLLLALGSLGTDAASQYFKSALLVLKNQATAETALWQVQCHFLVFFFYRHWGNAALAYRHLGTAITLAKVLDLHKLSQQAFCQSLYSSLFVNDTLYSMVYGKPTCLTCAGAGSASQLLSLSKIVNRILNSFYVEQDFTIFKLKDLSIELKSWSLNLPPEMYVTNVVKDYQLLNLHFVSLSAILLVSRPLFVYHIAASFDRTLRHDAYARVAKDYFVCCLTCALYSIQFVDSFRPVLHDVSSSLLVQLTQVVYASVLFLDHAGDHYGFELDYLVNALSKSVHQVPKPVGDVVSAAIAAHTVVHYAPIDLAFLKHFQDYFVNQEIAPTFRKSYCSYDSYDSAVLNKVRR